MCKQVEFMCCLFSGEWYKASPTKVYAKNSYGKYGVPLVNKNNSPNNKNFFKQYHLNYFESAIYFETSPMA